VVGIKIELLYRNVTMCGSAFYKITAKGRLQKVTEQCKIQYGNHKGGGHLGNVAVCEANVDFVKKFEVRM
jgi:hypothetical protein